MKISGSVDLVKDTSSTLMTTEKTNWAVTGWIQAVLVEVNIAK